MKAELNDYNADYASLETKGKEKVPEYMVRALIAAKNQVQHLHDMLAEEGFTPVTTIGVMFEIDEALKKANGQA